MAIQAVCFLMSHCILGIANERLGQIVSFHCFLTLTNLNLIMYLFSAGISGGVIFPYNKCSCLSPELFNSFHFYIKKMYPIYLTNKRWVSNALFHIFSSFKMNYFVPKARTFSKVKPVISQ